MKKQILNLGKALNKAEQKQVNGGYIPNLYQFCCTRTQGFWIDSYPFLGNDPYYTCDRDVCSNNTPW
ncbi:hypothetical protein [Tenacibaculum haliotis]|uniref:hypothetical protein n=1 Tax=Tenacibaculum haliotis TaxID=1888914 RepID=UPI0021AED844|nr:hypothetical protein [Tenacibaculum haliotis]MCT4699666.1 hypothetical protein [Tenacibaculum haliotis]